MGFVYRVRVLKALWIIFLTWKLEVWILVGTSLHLFPDHCFYWQLSTSGWNLTRIVNKEICPRQHSPKTFRICHRYTIIIINTRLQCALCTCALGTWLTRPIHDDNRRQSVFIYARCYQSFKLESIYTSYIIRGWSAFDERMRVTDLDKSSRSDVQLFLACAAHLLTLVLAYISSQLKGKGIKLVVLLRITRKLMNIDCARLKSCAAMTG